MQRVLIGSPEAPFLGRDQPLPPTVARPPLSPGHPQPLPLAPLPRGFPPCASSPRPQSALRRSNFLLSPWMSKAEPGTGAGEGWGEGRVGAESGGGETGGARTGATPPGRAWPQLQTLTWSAGCVWLALAPGVGCCSCFMAVIAGGPRRSSLPRGHFRLGDCHLAEIACHRRPSLSELAEGKAAAAMGGGGRGTIGRGRREAAGKLPSQDPLSTTADPLTPHSPAPHHPKI
jgi:hypothetical protein